MADKAPSDDGPDQSHARAVEEDGGGPEFRGPEARTGRVVERLAGAGELVGSVGQISTLDHLPWLDSEKNLPQRLKSCPIPFSGTSTTVGCDCQETSQFYRAI